jgi:hypothetical protein
MHRILAGLSISSTVLLSLLQGVALLHSHLKRVIKRADNEELGL